MDRSQLQTLLEELVGSGNVYFQPPGNVQMSYPCVVYQRDIGISTFADNKPFRFTKRYQVTVISTNPDDNIPNKIARLPMCVFNRTFVADNLHHDVFELYY